MASRYRETYARWHVDPDQFWREAATAVSWLTPPDRIFDGDAGPYGRWFPDASLNACFNLLDRHVAAGRGEQTAILYDSPLQGLCRSISYAALLEEVETLAAVLVAHGVTKGDRVLLYMPMVPEALAGIYACTRIGAVHSVVFGGFAPRELASRIEDAAPTMVLTASCGLEPGRSIAYKPLLDQAIALSAAKPAAVLVLQREQLPAALTPGRDHDWATAMAAARRDGRRAGCAAMQATDPLYILYTSGTTGVPKGVVRDTGSYLVALAWSMQGLYGIAPGEVFWTASDIGWVVGHSYIVYAPLLIGATTLLYEGKPVGTPDAGAFWRVCADHDVAALFTAPTAMRAIKKEDAAGEHFARHRPKALRAVFLAGERADASTVGWMRNTFGLPVIDHWWQTETGWAITGNPLGLGALPVKPGSSTVPMPGFSLAVVNEAAEPLPPGTMGSLVIRLPLPPGCLPTLWGDDARMRESYLAEFPGYYKTADAGLIDEDGYVFVLGRTDDIINCAGHRLSTGGMEEVLASHPAVAECAVIGVKDAIKGETPCGFLVLKSGRASDAAAVEAETVAMVRDQIGPVASFKIAITVERLPKTRSGKILRGTMKKIADGDAYAVPATIEDPSALETIAVALRGRGL